jgi:hypothetical protein
LHIILFLHLLSTNHKCTEPCYFPPAVQSCCSEGDEGLEFFDEESRDELLTEIAREIGLDRMGEDDEDEEEDEDADDGEDAAAPPTAMPLPPMLPPPPMPHLRRSTMKALWR